MSESEWTLTRSILLLLNLLQSTIQYLLVYDIFTFHFVLFHHSYGKPIVSQATCFKEVILAAIRYSHYSHYVVGTCIVYVP